MSLKVEDHKTASESMRTKCVCQDWDRNISLIIAIESKKISNDQELIQSDPISCPQNQKGNN